MRDPGFLILSFLGLANTIRNRLFLSFGLFLFIIIGSLSITYYSLQKIEEVEQLNRQMSTLETDILRMRVGLGKFLEEDVRNIEYYEKGFTANTQELEALDIKMDNTLNAAGKIAHHLDFHLRDELSALQQSLDVYRIQMKTLKTQVTTLGYKDFGVEGQMRKVIHELEDRQLISEHLYLAIRRNEKDFIMRGEQRYVDNVMQLSSVVFAERNKAGDTSSTLRLERYRAIFQKYVSIYKEIYDHSSGLRSRVSVSGQRLGQDCSEVSEKVLQMSKDEVGSIKFMILLVSFLSVALGIIISYYISRNLAQPLRRLAHHMDGYFSRSGSRRMVMSDDAAPKEIGVVAQSFNALTMQVEKQINEISRQNQKLEMQNSELIKLNSEMDKFVYHTSHDLRSPLTSIAGLVDLIKLEGAENRDIYLDYISQSVNRLDDTIKEIIHFYRNKNTPVEKSYFSLRELFFELCDQYRFSPDASQIDFVDEIVQDELWLDKYRLRIILRNLVSNSVKYHDPAKTNQFVKCSSAIHEKELLITLSDNGIGIEPENLPKIFDMFFRATDKSSGSGLGLFIVRESLRRVEGDILVTSTPGAGTTITIKLPVYSPDSKTDSEHHLADISYF